MKRARKFLAIIFMCMLPFMLSCGGGDGDGGTTDTTPPTISSTSPANGDTGVAVNSAISATCSEAMNASTITTATFVVATGGNNIPGTVTYSGTTATFTPSGNLSYSTTYTATITTGAKDSAGNAMASDYTWSFTTEATPPTVDVTGTWSGTWTSSNDIDHGNLAATLTQSGTSVSGTVSITESPCISSGSVSGTVSGNNVVFGVVSGTDTITYTATCTSTSMSGTYSVNTGECAGDTGTFSMTKGQAITPLDGTYSGPTSDSKRNITFSVDSNGSRISSMAIGFVDVPCHGGGLISISIPGGVSITGYTGPINITSGSFVANYESAPTQSAAGVKISVEGQFTSTTEASGRIEYGLTFSDGSYCSPGDLTWDATKS